MQDRWWRGLAAGLAFVLVAGLLPSQVCGRGGAALYAGDLDAQARLADGVATWLDAPPSGDAFHTGSERFDGEWLFGSSMMAAMGFGQLALEHPERAPVDVERLERCIDRMLDPKLRAFDRAAWGRDALEDLDGQDAHAAYLGYLGLALALDRAVHPTTRHAALGDAVASALERRLTAAPSGFLPTYPGETYPVDNAAVVAAIALHARAVGRPRPPVVAAWAATVRRLAIDPGTGLLVQALDPALHVTRGPARGSGTALAVYFLSFADVALARDLYAAVRRELYEERAGFGVVREYPRGEPGGGDIDSGPIAFGYGVSATGFALGASRVAGDARAFTRIYATAVLFGAPRDHGAARRFVLGGPLGDALLFAMLTAPPRSLAPSDEGAL